MVILKSKNIDIKIVVSSKVFFGKKGFKYFIGYKVAKKIRPRCIFFPKLSLHGREFDEAKYISFLIKEDELLEKYNEVWEKEFDGEPVYNEK